MAKGTQQPAHPLHGQHVLLTGATGFLGQATLERLLSDYPTTTISLLIRAKGSQPAADRLPGLLRKPVFRSWRERVGDDAVDQAVRDRVTVIQGDVSDGDLLEFPGDIDVVIHGASTVSFDPPIDEAFSTNVTGVVNLYEALARSGSDPHVVHISTAYVAGVRKGVVREAPLTHDVDWRTETSAAQAARAEVEAASRRPEVLRKAMAAARHEHGKAGPQAVVQAAEPARRAWVAERLVDYGSTRAQSLGWPDVYTLTKALGERAAENLWSEAGHRLSIVRPAIVESARTHPYPGWIDGFKMADPLILAYGRGILPEFPGLPDSVLDLIPVDHVVNATLAVAANPPGPPAGASGSGENIGGSAAGPPAGASGSGENIGGSAAGPPAGASESGENIGGSAAGPSQAQYFHVSSGARNPLPFREMYEHVHAYFQRHPMPDSERGHIQVPVWRFPGSTQVMRTLRLGEKAVEFADRALLRVPASERTRAWQSDVHRKTQELEILRKYADLYQAYTQAEVIYDDSKTLALHRAMPLARQSTHGFDSAEIDWTHYLQEVHYPSVTELMRAFTSRKRSRGGGEGSLPESSDAAAFFDLEGTVVASNMVEQYLWTKLASLSPADWPGELADLIRSLPRYLRAERRDRGDFIRTFMRRYEGVNEAELRALVTEAVGDALLQRAMPEAIRRIRAHRSAWHRTVLITGTIDLLVEPLAPLFDEIVAGRMHGRDGVWTGYLDRPPLVDEARAAWLRGYAQTAGLDLSQSYAYGDSHSDRAWLELVGNPQAVNPDAALYRHAKRKKWRVHSWGQHTQGRLATLSSAARLDVAGAGR